MAPRFRKPNNDSEIDLDWPYKITDSKMCPLWFLELANGSLSGDISNAAWCLFDLFGNLHDARQRKGHETLLTPGGLLTVSNGTTDLWWINY